MKNVDLYLHFNGNAEKAMNFYKKVFGGEFTMVQRYGDVPGSEKMVAEDKQKLIHIALPLSPNLQLMASDIVTKMESNITFGNNYHICLQAGSEKEADKLFNALSDDGRIEMPMAKTFWGAYFGMCLDQFGVQWMINFTYPQ
ncbi:VOC family protein [Paraflavitalea sp. CAU 1676]|uniref:VOC family protein n=1 Tax=Paraflavitalea sp. CAU 1676 TaxID=3032598 RepID=UPI0023DC03DF|nr:VOC family protein [Paraflavitalea sp. CAU 1676]MDF2192726.1 VOC family protein [Paraflavitalea sp. CAU 1676]